MFSSGFPNIYTSDINQALVFYRDLLEFEQTYQFPSKGEPEHVELRLGNSIIALSSYAAVKNVGVSTPTSGHPFEFVVWAEDTDRAVDRLRAAGVPVVIEPRDHISGHRRAYVTDPDGNWVAIVSHHK